MQARPVPAHNSVCPENIGVLGRPFYHGRHANDPFRDHFSGLLPVSASGLSGTGGAGPQASGGRSAPVVPQILIRANSLVVSNVWR